MVYATLYQSIRCTVSWYMLYCITEHMLPSFMVYTILHTLTSITACYPVCLVCAVSWYVLYCIEVCTILYHGWHMLSSTVVWAIMYYGMCYLSLRVLLWIIVTAAMYTYVSSPVMVCDATYHGVILYYVMCCPVPWYVLYCIMLCAALCHGICCPVL